MSNPITEARLLCGPEVFAEAEAVVHIEALLSLGGKEKPEVIADGPGLDAWKPRVVKGVGKPVVIEVEAEAEGCKEIFELPAAVKLLSD